MDALTPSFGIFMLADMDVAWPQISNQRLTYKLVDMEEEISIPWPYTRKAKFFASIASSLDLVTSKVDTESSLLNPEYAVFTFTLLFLINMTF